MDDFVGPGIYMVTYTNGNTSSINVTGNIVDANGHPIYLQEDYRTLHNWMNIISIRKDI